MGKAEETETKTQNAPKKGLLLCLGYSTKTI